MEYDVLAAAAGLGTWKGGQGRELLLQQKHDQLESYLTERVTVSVDGVGCSGELANTGVVEGQEQVYARSVLIYACPGSPSGGFTVRYNVFAAGDAVVDNHTNIVDYALGAATGTYVFDTGHHEFEAGKTGVLDLVARFIVMGAEHILSGIDHVLFIALLLLGARGWRSVLTLATSFTVAHSVTLIMGALGWVEVPDKIVEPLIALSIAYVAVENILGGASRHRPLVVFGFGLLHGLGFASTLSFTDQLGGRLLGSLVSFNVGVELGQLLIIGLLFPLLLLIRRFAWSSYAHVGATAVAGIFGFVWFFERFLT
ncbi:HupE/UreJ family protein [Nonomuraea sp. K274]|uniref:HupE/UreJ family protein n=1 Tax=Nonomuraea cypriaca TaxID=1187855 RepID=A0A931EX36_9ACTN|nr:HupE/UreJ family protein [Nonomuraea cypriaca]MBF8185092.1 HupE/UreJ family protein [Nonomuraea cypriaca]